MKKKILLAFILVLGLAAPLWAFPPWIPSTANVVGPASTTDGYSVCFDGATGKLLKDCGGTPATGDLIHSGTPAIHQWGIFTDSTHIKGVAVTASGVACIDSNGEPVKCTNLTDLAFSSYVPLSLFDAYTILYADTDNTPAPLTVSASTIVGRKATGGIVALSGAEALAIVGGQAALTLGTDYCGPAPEINCSGGCTTEVTAAKARCGAIIQNYGQAAANINATLPTVGASMSFVVDIGTAQASNYFRVTADTANICLDQTCGTLYTYIQFAAPAQYDEFSCRSAKNGAAYIWKCSTGHGTLTGG